MNRRHAAILAGAAVLLVIAWFAVLWSPTGADLADARERRTMAESEVGQLRTKLTELRAAQRKGPALQALAAKVKAAVPDTPDLEGFLLAVSDAAGRSQVAYDSITPAPVAASTTGGPNQVAITISVEGGYHNVVDFLDRLVALPRVVVVDRLSLDGDQQTGKLSVTVGGRIFTTAAPGTTAGAPVGATTTSTTTPASTPQMVP